jgi:hypothetical protein
MSIQKLVFKALVARKYPIFLFPYSMYEVNWHGFYKGIHIKIHSYMRVKWLTGIFLLSVATAKAQNVTIGPTIGVNHSWQNNVENKQFKPGLNVGVFGIYSIDPHWALGADIRFSMEGVKSKMETSVLETTYKANLNYIRIPVKGYYFFGKKANQFRPKVYAGPSIGFLVGGSSSIETDYVNPQTPTVITKTPSKNSFKSVDFGVVIGTGFNYRLHKKGIWLNADINYTHGFPDIAKSSILERSNRNLLLSVGIGFPLGTF